jgi:hypothetical protein
MQLTSDSPTSEKGHAAACKHASTSTSLCPMPPPTGRPIGDTASTRSHHSHVGGMQHSRAASAGSTPRAFAALLPSLLLLLVVTAASGAAAAAGAGANQQRRAVWQHARAGIQAAAAQLPVHVGDGGAAAGAAPHFGIATGTSAVVGDKSHSDSTGHSSNGSTVAPASLQRLRRSLQARGDIGRPASGGITGAGTDAAAWAALAAMDPVAAEALQSGHGRALLARGVNSQATYATTSSQHV